MNRPFFAGSASWHLRFGFHVYEARMLTSDFVLEQGVRGRHSARRDR